MVVCFSCYVAALENGTRSSLDTECIKHATFWAKEKCGMIQKRIDYLLQIMSNDPTIREAPLLGDKSDLESFRACKHAMMLVLRISKYG